MFLRRERYLDMIASFNGFLPSALKGSASFEGRGKSDDGTMNFEAVRHNGQVFDVLERSSLEVLFDEARQARMHSAKR